jgi:hypothetical protein
MHREHVQCHHQHHCPEVITSCEFCGQGMARSVHS